MRFGDGPDRSEQPTIPQTTLLYICGFYLTFEQLGSSSRLTISGLHNVRSSRPGYSSFRTRIVADAHDLGAAAAKKVEARLRPPTEQIIPNRRVVRREPHISIFREDFAALEDLAAELG